MNEHERTNMNERMNKRILMRGVTTHAADYQVPVGEYGRHWNFFATLAVVSLLAAALPVPTGSSAAVGAAVLARSSNSIAHSAAWLGFKIKKTNRKGGRLKLGRKRARCTRWKRQQVFCVPVHYVNVV